MAASEDKYREAACNLNHLKRTAAAYAVGDGGFDDVRYSLNSFVNAARAVTFALQKQYRGKFSAAFDSWYEARRDRLSRFKWFLNLRNINQKEGNRLPYYRPTSRDSNGNTMSLTIDYSKDGQQQLIGFGFEFSENCAPHVKTSDYPDEEEMKTVLLEMAMKRSNDLLRGRSGFKRLTGLNDTFMVVDDDNTELTVQQVIEEAVSYLQELKTLVKEAKREFGKSTGNAI
jgi:hypothetical protein